MVARPVTTGSAGAHDESVEAVRQKKEGLVSRRIEMYEAPFRQASRGYRSRPQDSFTTKRESPPPVEETREDTSSPEIDPDTHPDPDLDDPEAVPDLSSKSYVGSALVESGVRYYSNGEYEKARKAFTTALKTQRVSFRNDDICIALTLGNLGSVYLQQGNLDAAEEVLQEALDIKRRLAPGMIVADTLNNLGNCANLRGNYDLSLSFYNSALSDLKVKAGKKSDIASTLFNMGRLNIQLQQWNAAMKALNEAYTLTREIYGKNHTFVAQTLDLIGFVKLSSEDFEAAMLSFTAALAIHRNLHGPIHLEVANSLFNVGMVREAKGDLNDAWEAYTTSRDLYVRFGTDCEHPSFKTVQKSIGNVERAIGKQKQQRLVSKHKHQRSRVRDSSTRG